MWRAVCSSHQNPITLMKRFSCCTGDSRVPATRSSCSASPADMNGLPQSADAGSTADWPPNSALAQTGPLPHLPSTAKYGTKARLANVLLAHSGPADSIQLWSIEAMHVVQTNSKSCGWPAFVQAPVLYDMRHWQDDHIRYSYGKSRQPDS